MIYILIYSKHGEPTATPLVAAGRRSADGFAVGDESHQSPAADVVDRMRQPGETTAACGQDLLFVYQCHFFGGTT